MNTKTLTCGLTVAGLLVVGTAAWAAGTPILRIGSATVTPGSESRATRATADGAGPLRHLRLQIRQRILHRFDANQDGQLNEQERGAAKDAIKVRVAGVKAAIVARFDANEDGKLDEQERSAAKSAIKARLTQRFGPKFVQKLGEKRAAIIRRFDSNGDGALNDQERAAAKDAIKAKLAEKKAAIIARFDSNHDGQLNDQERAAARQALQARIAERVQAWRQQHQPPQ